MIGIVEPLFRKGHQTIRRFSASAGVRCRGFSLLLQRVVTDLSSDMPYEQSALKVQEHYGVTLGSSSIRRVTMLHAQQMLADNEPDPSVPTTDGVERVIAQMDGCMVPIVESDPESQDRRKNKRSYWKELKLCLAHEAGSKSVVYGGAFSGGAAGAGKRLLGCAVEAGFGRRTQVHAVGDGAKWIADQVEEQFGGQGRYMIDLYHLCEYLSGAAPQDAATVKKWVDRQKCHLKAGRVKQVIAELRSRLEPGDVSDEEAPVRRCYRYMINREKQFFYQEAIAKELPIGSGEIESAHRHVVQNRLKLSGAWWDPDNVDKILALRTTRANGKWQGYWNDQFRMAA